jgi:hypothetical protein
LRLCDGHGRKRAGAGRFGISAAQPRACDIGERFSRWSFSMNWISSTFSSVSSRMIRSFEKAEKAKKH